MSYEHEAARLRKLARRADVTVWFSNHGDDERQKDNIAKIDVHNMLKRCQVTKVEESGGEDCWRAEGTDIDGRQIAAEIVAYEDDPPEIKIVTTWAKKSK